jgi:SGNH domain (fused to AT3 domains)
MPGLDAACKACDVAGIQATISSTPPLLNFIGRSKFGLNEQAPAFNRAAMDFAIANKVDFVLLACEWDEYADKPDFEPCLDRTVEELVQAGIRVGLVRDVAMHRGDVPMTLSMAAHRGLDIDRIGLPIAEHLARNERANAAFDRLKGVGVSMLDPAPWFVDDNGLWRAQIDGVAMVRDFHHLSVEGGLRVTPMFEALFDAKNERTR